MIVLGPTLKEFLVSLTVVSPIRPRRRRRRPPPFLLDTAAACPPRPRSYSYSSCLRTRRRMSKKNKNKGTKRNCTRPMRKGTIRATCNHRRRHCKENVSSPSRNLLCGIKIVRTMEGELYFHPSQFSRKREGAF